MKPARTLLPKLLLPITLSLLASCAGTYKQTLNFDPQQPLRVAIVPFVAVDSQGKIIPQEGRLIVDNLSLISSKVELTPVQVVRQAVINELKKTPLDVVSTALIDIDLPHHGYANDDGTLNIEKVIATPAAQFCKSLLSCDAVLYGTVKDWDRAYYGLQTVNSVNIELKLVSAKTGETLFFGSAKDSESRGISKIPTGISDLVLEPIRGLDSEIIDGLAKTTVKNLLKPLVGGDRPEFVDKAPPAIFAASHDAGLTRKTPLVVVMFGSEGDQASFSVGDYAQAQPMLERTPGHFYGEYYPLETDSFTDQPVTVSLTDQYGRTSILAIPKPAVSLN